MIAQIFAHARQGVADRDAMFGEQFWLPDAREFQQLRRVDTTGADDNLAAGPGLPLHAAQAVTHAETTAALQQQGFSQGAGFDP